MARRHLESAGCRNVRDLGGLPTADGRSARPSGISVVHVPVDDNADTALLSEVDIPACLRDAGPAGRDIDAVRDPADC